METPVLLLIYNRPESTKRVLQRLQKLGVRKLYVWGDGPKNTKDDKRVSKVKEHLIPFELMIKKSRFSSDNNGCRKSVLGGINWFFSHVNEGIILEDDCLPSPHFFSFSNNLLNHYREVEQVKMISGNNPLGRWHSQGGHFFSRIGHSWGWATWRNRWEAFDHNLPRFEKFVAKNGFEKAFGPTELAAYQKKLTQQSLKKKIDTWDYQWSTHILMSDGLAAIPECNLVMNIGFNDRGTHTHKKPEWINTEVSENPIITDKIPYTAEREYEMELYLARRQNKPALFSSEYYCQLGKTTSKKLNVLLINSTDMGGGAEKITFSLHKKLLEMGHDCTLLVKHKKTDLTSIVEIQNDIKTQVSELNPDLVHIHNLHETSIMLKQITEISTKFPTIYTLHDSWLNTGSTDHPFALNAFILSYLELKQWNIELNKRKKVIKNFAIRFTAPSQWMRDKFFSVHNLRPHFVPNGIAYTNSKRLEIPSKRFILFVANRPATNPYRDLLTLKKAWKMVNKTLGTLGCDLICLGGNSEKEKVEQFYFHILKSKSEQQVQTFMQAAILIVQPSNADNAPLTIIEAHSVGKPVVASLVDGIPEMLSQKETEWLYEPENSKQLAANLVDAIRFTDAGNTVKTTPYSTIDKITHTYLGHYLEMTSA